MEAFLLCLLVNKLHVFSLKQQTFILIKIVEEFCNILGQNKNHISSSDIKIILGDFKANIVKENIHNPTFGYEILYNETNNNGIKMIYFAVSKMLKETVQRIHIKIFTQ
jgi:hypothetical protein